jgi:hypothetical protein
MEILIFFPLLSSNLSIVAIFNIPAILGLVFSLLYTKVYSFSFQKRLKMLLKVGIAKSFGGILLAAYMGLKFTSLKYEHSNKEAFDLYVAFKQIAFAFALSALVDIFYGTFAWVIIKKTREIIRELKEKQVREYGHRLLKYGESSNRSSPLTSPKVRNL